MTDHMDPSASPDLLSADPQSGAGAVRRLNKLPLALAIGTGAALCSGLGYSVYVLYEERAESDTRTEISTQIANVGTLMNGAPTAGLIEGEGEGNSGFQEIVFQPPLVTAAGPVQKAETPPAQQVIATAPPQPDPDEEARKAEARRIAQLRQQRMEAALLAPTRVDLASAALQSGQGGISTGIQNNVSFPGGGVPDGGSGYDQQADPNLQQRKEDFLAQDRPVDYLQARREAPLSPFEIKAGTIIPGVMVGGINSDLPGQILAQVSQDVWDSSSGNHLLIPQGSKLVGVYDSRVAMGQERVLVTWSRINFPDGSTLNLSNMPGADQAGYAGFNDQVNNHYFRIFGSAILLSLVSAGFSLSQDNDDDGETSNQETVANAVGAELGNVSGQVIRRNLNIQPTLEIRPGYRFNIMVNRDVIIDPYRS